ncbi:hypothetical protein Tco_0459069 [Tanacetum coccineum]
MIFTLHLFVVFLQPMRVLGTAKVDISHVVVRKGGVMGFGWMFREYGDDGYLEIEMMCVEFGCVECDCHFEVEIELSGFGIGEVELSTFDVLQMFVFFLQMGFTLILATLDGLDVCLLGDVIGEDDGDEGE